MLNILMLHPPRKNLPSQATNETEMGCVLFASNFILLVLKLHSLIALNNKRIHSTNIHTGIS